MQLIKGFSLTIVACVLIWRMMTLGLAEHYSRRGGDQDIAKALSWAPDHAPALFQQARRLTKEKPTAAETLLIRSIAGDPTHAPAYAELAVLRAARHATREAAVLMNTASHLAPRRVPVQLTAGTFWLRQGHLDLALGHWDVALTLRPSLGNQLYPVLLTLLTDPRAASAFPGLLKEPPPWWPSFFAYAARQGENLDVLRWLYRWSRTNDRPLSSEERRAYIARLQKEGQWLEAYFVWLNSLDKPQSAVLGNLYNGGFELPLGDEDFNWRNPGVSGVMVGTAVTAGAQDSKALRIVFQDKDVAFQHLYQRLVLPPGRYQLRGLLKLDSLQATQGLQWQLKCQAMQGTALLGGSERFLGSAPWQAFAFDFAVPAGDCPAQELKLVLAGRLAQDFKAKGTAWFDAMSIRRNE